MTLKTPLPDEVFQKFLKTMPEKDIEKKFGRKSNEISAMEVVGKEIHKSPALLFQSVVRKKETSKRKSKRDYFTYKQVEKEKFYEFSKDISSSDWKENETDIFLYNKVSGNNCSKCNGKGVMPCKKCDGNKIVVCEGCKKDKDLICKTCKDEGEISFKLEVYIEPEGKKEKLDKKIRCPDCHGAKTLLCQVCGGTKKNVCSDCRGVGGESCKKCEGTGMIYNLKYEPVPFTDSSEVHVFLNSNIEKELNKAKILKGKELLDLLEKGNVQSIKISSLKDLDQKHLEDELGFWDNNASSQVKECKKAFGQLEKNSTEDPKFPIEIYPLQKIDIETYKGKKFSVCSVGSQQGFIVFDLNF